MKKIGILVFWKEKTKGRYYTLSSDVYKMLENLGAFPVLIPNGGKRSTLLMDECEGLIIPGGPDICPEVYGEYTRGATCYCEDQDLASLQLIQEAHQRKLPIFGICRGMQLLNIYFGGTLIQDIKTHPKHHQLEKRYEEVHQVSFLEDSLLAKYLHTNIIGVNSLHHQAIKILGNGLQVSAYDVDDDMIIEAIESQDKKILGVQWHPENIMTHHTIVKQFFDI